MSFAHDIYAETNPAFCAFAIAAFAKGYISTRKEGVDLATIYLALPIALSGDLIHTFDGTNKNTGLIEWIHRLPEITIKFADRVNSTLGISSEAIRFGCLSQILKMSEKTNVLPGSIKPKKLSPSSTELTLKRAERLGHWFAGAGSSRSVFEALGVTP